MAETQIEIGHIRTIHSVGCMQEHAKERGNYKSERKERKKETVVEQLANEQMAGPAGGEM